MASSLREFLDGIDKPRRAKLLALIKRAFVLLHALEKRTDTLPEHDIRRAETRMKQHLEQLEDNWDL